MTLGLKPRRTLVLGTHGPPEWLSGSVSRRRTRSPWETNDGIAAALVKVKGKEKEKEKRSIVLKRGSQILFSWGSRGQLSTASRSRVRSLLREASYLPDPNARLFIRAKVLGQTRKNAFRIRQHRDNPTSVAEWTKLALQQANKALNQLRRANEGERSRLLRVLFMTYGRIGSRRYELLKPLYQTDRSVIHDLMEPSSTKSPRSESPATGTEDYDALDGPEVDGASTENSSSGGSLDGGDDLPALTPEIYALAKSQKQANPPTHTRKNPRHLEPNIPATNNRMLPMPKKRIKNMHRKWYADFLNRLLPPLPTKEWEQLRDWSQGHNLPDRVIPRRNASERLHFGKYSALEATVLQGRIDNAVYGNREAHKLTPRYMQHLWATVFSISPYMVYNDETKEWRVLWGHHELATSMLAMAQEFIDDCLHLQSTGPRRFEDSSRFLDHIRTVRVSPLRNFRKVEE